MSINKTSTDGNVSADITEKPQPTIKTYNSVVGWAMTVNYIIGENV